MNASNSLAIAAASFGDDVKAFRSASVTSENKGNVAAKSLLASLLAGVYTKDLATAAIIHAFGNPKGKNGKVIDKLSGLRNSTGGDGVRKMAETVFRIFDNIDADSVVPEGSDYKPAIRTLVTDFVLGNKGAPKSLRALNESVSASLRAYAKVTQPDNSEAETENKEADGGSTADSAPQQSLSDRTLALMVAFEASTDDEKRSAYDALNALLAMVEDDAAIIAYANEMHPDAAAA